MTGFFWMANNFAISTFGKGKETMEFLSKSTILNQVIGISVPILSALVINWFGYRGSFILMLVFALIMFFAVNLIPKIKLDVDASERYIPMLKDSKTKWMIVSSFVGGMFTSFQSVFILIYTFTVTDNKLIIALLSVGYTIISLLTYYAYKKGSWMGENKWLAFGMVLMSIGFISALAGNAAFFILSNILTTIGSFFTGSVYSAQIFRVFEKDNPSVRANMLVIYEWALNLGRVMMLVFVMFIKFPKGTYFLTLMSIAILLSLLIPLIQKKMLQFKKSV
jgi:MFS family permease